VPRYDVQGKVVLITGGARGIGFATAEALARRGASLALVDLDQAQAEAAAERIGAGRAIGLAADVSDAAAIQRATAAAIERFGGLDVVVANAGVQLAGEDDRADRLDLDVWRRTIDINLTGIFLTCKHGIGALLESGGRGSVVCTCSPTGLFGCAPGYDAYSSSKAGVAGLVRVLAADYAPDIRVNGVVPGYTDTPMTSWVSPEEHEALLATIPMRRAGRADEVAAVMAFLASDEASYTTGAIWAADGGMTAI
jgi:NAD(P)-dependent dehydrogenase (short-subunit alcohol dehydrogenase family)